jgi:hypothetical protein
MFNFNCVEWSTHTIWHQSPHQAWFTNLPHASAASRGLFTRRVWWEFTCASLDLKKNSHKKMHPQQSSVRMCPNNHCVTCVTSAIAQSDATSIIDSQATLIWHHQSSWPSDRKKQVVAVELSIITGSPFAFGVFIQV